MQRRSTQAQLALLAGLLDACPTGELIAHGARLEVLYANAEAQRLSGSELRGKLLAEAFGALGGRLAAEASLVLGDGRPRELSGEAAPGSGRLLRLSLRRSKGSEPGLFLDVIDATEAEHAAGRIDTLLQERARSLRLRDEFLDVASHELRTPMTTAQLRSGALLRALDKEPIDLSLVREHASSLGRVLQRVSSLVVTLLDISLIGKRVVRLNVEELDLVALLASLCAPHAAARVKLSAPESLVGRWDRQRLSKVVGALLSNAVKFGEGKPIEVRAAQSESGVTIEVVDRGIGVPAGERERIFERFSRAVSERNYGGLGLGLWTARSLVESMGGTIALGAPAGPGSTFSISLPWNVARGQLPMASGEPAPPAPHTTPGATVLVVEDNPLVLRRLQRMLGIAGYRALPACSAQEARKLADEEPGEIQLLITDVLMPGGGGLELAAELSRTREGLRVLFISGYSEEAFRELDSEFSHTAFLEKPFNQEQLARRIRSLI